VGEWRSEMVKNRDDGMRTRKKEREQEASEKACYRREGDERRKTEEM
jgi:hypothetical protein